MALQIATGTSIGVEAATAYFFITSFHGTKTNVTFTLDGFYDLAARDGGESVPIASRNFTMPITDGVVSMAALYAHIKTQPGFTEATDV